MTAPKRKNYKKKNLLNKKLLIWKKKIYINFLNYQHNNNKFWSIQK